jgi:tetratricopeptide (TPR) repeat protein
VRWPRPGIPAAEYNDFSQISSEKSKKGGQFRLSEQSRVAHVIADSDIDIKVPQTEISFRGLIRYVRDLLGIPVTKISGSCMMKNNSLIILVSVTGYESFCIDSTWPTLDRHDSLENALLRAAQETFLRIEPFTAAVYNYNHGKRSEALVAIGKCLSNKTADDDHQALALWGRILADLKQYRLAVEKCEESLSLRPGYIYAALHRANALDDWGEIDQTKKKDALESYCKIIASNPTATNAYIDRGIYFSRLKEHRAEAVRDFEKALELEPRSATIKNQLILAKVRSGAISYSEAIEFLSEALQLTDDAHKKASMLIDRARLYADSGNAEKAIEDYQASVKEDPTSAVAWDNLGVELTKRDGNTLEVLGCHEKALNIDPVDDNVLLNIGYTHQGLGMLTEAKKDFEKVVASETSKPDRRQKAKRALEELAERMNVQEVMREEERKSRRKK